MKYTRIDKAERRVPDLGVKTDDYFDLIELTKHHPKPRKKAEEIAVAPQPVELPYLYPQASFYPHTPYRKDGLLSKLGRALTLFRNITFCISLMTTWPAVATVVASGCAGVAVWLGGYKLHKAPETEAGKVVAKIEEAKNSGIFERTKDKIKHVTSEPLEAVKEKAKSGVEKATAKAAEIKEEVGEAKDKAVEKVDELKTAIVGAKADAKAEPGLLERAGDQIAAIPAAVLPPPMPAEQVKAMQEKHKAEVEKVKRGVRRAGQNRFIDGFGGVLGGMSIERARIERENQQRGNEAAQWNQIKHEQYRQSMGIRY